MEGGGNERGPALYTAWTSTSLIADSRIIKFVPVIYGGRSARENRNGSVVLPASYSTAPSTKSAGLVWLLLLLLPLLLLLQHDPIPGLWCMAPERLQVPPFSHPRHPRPICDRRRRFPPRRRRCPTERDAEIETVRFNIYCRQEHQILILLTPDTAASSQQTRLTVSRRANQ